MIGVVAASGEREVVCEFFELFKTPWEFYRRDRRYETLVCSGDSELHASAKLVIRYSGRKTHFDHGSRFQAGLQGRRSCIRSHQGNQIPIYGDTITFPKKRNGLLTDEASGQCVAYLHRSRERVIARIGYDLFGEVRTLLSKGQPVANANMPTLELHIALLRNLITACGVQLVEIPPVPDGYRFIACLTHDVDHPSIRQHKWDHTTLGFLYRAIFGSLRNLLRGRMSVRGLAKNWIAALKLPFIHLGLVKDIWREFDDRYLELENGLRSTFFFIPFKNCAGRDMNGSAPKARAARYGAQDMAETIEKLKTAGCEVALHGIDAWRDHSRGSEELRELRGLTGAAEIGVRMHWLYYGQQSPATLEKAGAAYDSTIGYNETVGYRAGTTQVYKPIEAIRLLELPLHVMDTALFYPAYLGLSPRQAKALLERMADNAVRFGGCLTINWHDRSVAPERLWDTCYRDLVQDLKSRGAWFATAGQAVAWFRKRRAAAFEAESSEPGAVRAKVAGDYDDNLPGLRLRICQAGASGDDGAYVPEGDVDMSGTRIEYLTALTG
jgi:hypothetical protein